MSVITKRNSNVHFILGNWLVSRDGLTLNIIARHLETEFLRDYGT